MENPIQDFEFLDLSNVNESERHQLQSVLYAPRDPNGRYPELPWCGGIQQQQQHVEPPPPPLDWMPHQQYDIGSQHFIQGPQPIAPSCTWFNPHINIPTGENEILVNGNVEDQEDESQEDLLEEDNTDVIEGQSGSVYHSPGVAQHQAPPPHSVSSNVPPLFAPAPYSNVFVGNMTANVSVHGYGSTIPAAHIQYNVYPHSPPSQVYQTNMPVQHSGGEPNNNGRQKRHKSNQNGSNNRRIVDNSQNNSVEASNNPAGGQHPSQMISQHFRTPYEGYYYPSYIPPTNSMYMPSHMQGYPMYQHNYGPNMYLPTHQPYQFPINHQIPTVDDVQQSQNQQHQHQPLHVTPPHSNNIEKSIPSQQTTATHQTSSSHTTPTNKQQGSPQSMIEDTQIENVVVDAQQQNDVECNENQVQQETSSQSGWENQNEIEEHNDEEQTCDDNIDDGYFENDADVNNEEVILENIETEITNNDIPQQLSTSSSSSQYKHQVENTSIVNTNNNNNNNNNVGNSKQSNNLSLKTATTNTNNVENNVGENTTTTGTVIKTKDLIEESNECSTTTTSSSTSNSTSTTTWASLFKNKNGVGVEGSSTRPLSSESNKNEQSSTFSGTPQSKPCARVEPLNTSSYHQNQSNTSSTHHQVSNNRYNNSTYDHRLKSNGNMSNDVASPMLGKLLMNTKLEHKGRSLQPRGLINPSNYCYINATLQALIACPPFYNLLISINENKNLHSNRQYYNHNNSHTESTHTPIFNAMLQLASEFSYLQLAQNIRRENKDLVTGTPFEPTYVYQILNNIKCNSAFNVEGRQEDAEEFLTFLLNGLNDEMLELIKSQKNSKYEKEGFNVDKLSGHHKSDGRTNLTNGDMNGDLGDVDDGDWKEVTKESKNKGSIVRRHTSTSDKTPVSEIFRGHLRTKVHRVSDSSNTENIQPFFTLPLDIEKVSSVKEALEQFVIKEGLEGVTCIKTNQETEAFQTVTIEELPTVLLLHLKCFDYKLQACQKIQKPIEFGVSLNLDSKLLSNSNKNKKIGGVPQSGARKQQYKLFAVVYHDGKEATNGHYITDVFHVGYSGWIRYDDSIVRFVPESEVLRPKPPRVPYILYYRRADTIISKNVASNS